ncbi:MAG: sn-glycerol-1-phosphate dehydrogenase [Thermoprotei archaeon]
MSIKLMRFSSNIVAGLGSINKLGETLLEFKIPKKVVMLCGANTFRIAGRRIYDSLTHENFSVEVISEGIKPSLTEVDLLVGRVKKIGSTDTVVLAVGGGSTIDVAKYVANALSMELVAIPTLLSSDAMATGYSVLWSGKTNKAIYTKTPTIIIGDYEILQNQPKRFVAAGVGDMLSKYSALYDWRLSFWLANERYNDFAMNVAHSTTELLKKRIIDVAKMNYIGIETLFLAEITDGYLMELSGTTRVAAGSEHLFTFAIETLADTGLHGEYCGLGTIMMTYLQPRDSSEVKRLLETVSAPTTANQLDLKKEHIVKALTMAHKMRNWYTILGSNGLSEGSAERLARYTGII